MIRFVRLAEFISSSNPEGVEVTPVVLRVTVRLWLSTRVKSADLVVVGQTAAVAVDSGRPAL